MKKLGFILMSIIVLSGAYTPGTRAEYDPKFCDQFKGASKIWWDGVELKSGQIGRLYILKDTPLYKLEGDQEIFERTLKAGENYRIYAFKPGMLSVGGGYYVDRDPKVKYETPSKSKLNAVKCINGSYKPQQPEVPQYPQSIKSDLEKSLYDSIVEIKSKVKSEQYETYSDYLKALEALGLDYKKNRENISPYASDTIFSELGYFNGVLRGEQGKGKIIVTFKNNDSYMLTNYLEVKRYKGQYYFGFSTLRSLYSVLNKKFYIDTDQKFPAGIKGRVQTLMNFPGTKVFLEPDNLNSEYYYEYSITFPKVNKELKFNSLSSRIDNENDIFPAITLQELIDNFGENVKVEISPDEVINIKFLDLEAPVGK